MAMKDCCHNKEKDLEKHFKSQANVLWAVFWINFIMFFIEFIFGLRSRSSALTADSLDMLGDSLAYGSSLWALKLGDREKARTAQFKAFLMLVFGLFVLGSTLYRAFFQSVPHFESMGMIGVLALVMNLICLFLLTKHKNDDINFSSVWLCSRNDIIANLSLLGAAFLVFLFQNPLPDLVVGLGITGLFLKSSFSIFSEAKVILRSSGSGNSLG
jgi:Co/Zn/Cd efflux system component